MQLFDLHSHSHYSDGILSPAELVLRAKQQKVDALALTDHDNIDGLSEATAAAASADMVLIPGIEFSCQWQNRGVHIVGLNINPHDSELLLAIQEQRNARQQRAELIAEKLARVGVPDALAGAKRIAEGGALGRPHFARYLVEAGFVKNINQAFKRYLGAGKTGDVKQAWPALSAVVSWIVHAGGVAVLAHPAKYKMTRSKLCAMVADFKQAGGEGIELVCGRQSPEVTSNIVNIAKQYKLLGSCGSDFHIPDQPWQELGQFGGYPSEVQPVWSRW